MADRVLIYEDELLRMGRWIERSRFRETGGDLFGFFTHSGYPMVQFVLGPGPGARAGARCPSSKTRSTSSGPVRCCARHMACVGEWHAHHTLGLAEPSAGDVETVRSAMRSCGLAR